MQSVWVRACNLFDVQNIAELEIVSGSKAAAKSRQMFIPVGLWGLATPKLQASKIANSPGLRETPTATCL